MREKLIKYILRKNGIKLTVYARKLHAVCNYINNTFLTPLLVTYLHFYIAVKNKFSQNIQYTQLTIMLNL